MNSSLIKFSDGADINNLTQFQREHLKNPFVTAYDLEKGHIIEVIINEEELL